MNLYNKRIKIKPYPNFQITNECFENDIKSKSSYIRIIDLDKIDYEFINFYLRIKNIELHKYFEKSKNKVEPWRTKGIPDEYRNFFIEKEDKDIELFLNMVSDKYYKK